MRRGAVAAALVGAALVLSGCQYLMGPLAGPMFPDDPGFGSFDPNDPAFSFPPPDATFTMGSAVLTIDGTALNLDRLAGNGTFRKGMGTDVGWTDSKGTYVRFFGSIESGISGFVSIDRISDGQHLGVPDPTACTVKVDKADATGVAGSATCKGAHWMDMLNGFAAFAPPSPGPAFDAAITFEATP